ncbi:MAG TPA: DUF4437 domain-containing protein [Sphingomicrobium sp.]|nr:DUF4437 domain-containing protein [Sphingomicrobium sp.]
MKAGARLAMAALAAGLAAPAALVAQDGPKASPSLRIAADEMSWRQQTPELATMISELWGDRQVDGGAGAMLRLPPGFDSGLHAHSGEFHGIVIRGAMIHEGPNGEGRDKRLPAGSYVRQAGGEMHIDKCVSEEPCEFFVFQDRRADIIWPDRR